MPAAFPESFTRRITVQDDGCWAFATLTGSGYGWFQEARAYAHRFAYEAVVGPIPDGMVIDHLCRNARCVNPAHMEAVTQRENVMRGTGPTAINASRTHCKTGHPFDEHNTYVTWDGRRQCRACSAAKAARRRARQATEAAA